MGRGQRRPKQAKGGHQRLAWRVDLALFVARRFSEGE